MGPSWLRELLAEPTPAPSGEALAAFERYAVERSADLGRLLTLVLTAANLASWPADFLFCEPPVARRLVTWRLTELGIVGFVHLLSHVDALRKRWFLVMGAALPIGVAASVGLTAPLAAIQPPLLYPNYLLPMATLMVMAPLSTRCLMSALLLIALIGTIPVASPATAELPGFSLFILTLYVVAALAIVGGHIVFSVVRRNFFQRRELARVAQGLAGAKRELESRVATRSHELRALAAHLTRVLEDERARVAREIHDDLGQALGAMRLDLDAVVRRSPAGAEVRARMDRVTPLLDGAIAMSRRILTRLRPRVLDDLGLVAAILWLSEEFEAEHGCRCDLSIDDPSIDVDPARSVAVFRILQESLLNVARHACARRAEISLGVRGGVLVLVVRDDGRGFSPDTIRPTATGLLGMRERAWQFGGRVEIVSEPGHGTTISARIPVEGASLTRPAR